MLGRGGSGLGFLFSPLLPAFLGSRDRRPVRGVPERGRGDTGNNASLLEDRDNEEGTKGSEFHIHGFAARRPVTRIVC